MTMGPALFTAEGNLTARLCYPCMRVLTCMVRRDRTQAPAENVESGILDFEHQGVLAYIS